jgi:hypothetical protein
MNDPEFIISADKTKGVYNPPGKDTALIHATLR